MFGILHSKKGFTLVELIVVVIIVGILASVAIPMMSGNIAAAKKTEAIAAMGTIRTVERLVKAETTGYQDVAAGAFNATANVNKYINSPDLNGKYYNAGNYSVTGNVITATVGFDTSAPGGTMNMDTGATT